MAKLRVEIKLQPSGEPPATELRVGTSTTIVVIRPVISALVVPDENSRLERAIWLPDHEDPTPTDGKKSPSTTKQLRPGLALAAAVWGYALKFPDREVFVAGHTDKSGSDEFNEALS
ncbi:MAG: hypothetical protein V3V08_17080 [Nannocystaceae bacterium]